ncbi:hypothetical protein GCM10017056_43980 [Seohaeicola zhoushanensis]|uniref:Uncharacterized protein n=1 Tax=Seohaeicola zhoushanensis TaxID=1569283 RepID=A0A8J3H2D5_9RHOB|nr:hypothetical protein GCM10017056_43980 [Seohaeicola zhoushanensis]
MPHNRASAAPQTRLRSSRSAWARSTGVMIFVNKVVPPPVLAPLDLMVALRKGTADALDVPGAR